MKGDLGETERLSEHQKGHEWSKCKYHRAGSALELGEH